MGAIETTVDRFDGGISQDRRSKDQSKYSLLKHFDAHIYPHKLVPHYTTEAAETKTMTITGFLYGQSTSATTFRLFGYGTKTDASGTLAVWKYDVLTPSSSWATPNNNASTLAKANSSVPVFFKYKEYIYMWTTNKLVRFDAESEGAFSNDAISTLGGVDVTFTDVAQPVHHLADDIAYFFSDNKVHKLNNTTWTSNALTLPDNLKITSACQYGNYLAIACTNKGSFSALADVQSVVFLWDRDSSVTTLADRIDFGRGAILFLANLDNKLIAVMDYYLASDLQGIALNRPKLIIKEASGGTGKIINFFEFSGVGTISQQVPFIRDNVIYFSASSLSLHSETHRGIMSVDSNGKIAFELVVAEEPTVYEGVFVVGNQWWIAHGTDGSVDRSDDGRTYSTTLASVYESLINGGDARLDSRRTKKLIGVTVNTEFLPANGEIKLYYRKDKDISAGSWTLIFDNTTDDSISHGAINIESSGATLPEFKEIQFKIESLGGAVPTYLSFASEFIDRELY